jgi:hypothetical protein
MSVTNYAAAKILDKCFGAIDFTPPTNYYMGLSTTPISSSGSNATEPVSGSYARVLVADDKTYFGWASGPVITTGCAITFPVSGSSWGTITHIGFWDTITSGSVWFYEALPVAKVVQIATQVSFDAGAISITTTGS